MFYVMNFLTHKFTSCRCVEDAILVVEMYLESGLNKDNLEIINCFPDGVRHSVDEFYSKIVEEGRK